VPVGICSAAVILLVVLGIIFLPGLFAGNPADNNGDIAVTDSPPPANQPDNPVFSPPPADQQIATDALIGTWVGNVEFGSISLTMEFTFDDSERFFFLEYDLDDDWLFVHEGTYSISGSRLQMTLLWSADIDDVWDDGYRLFERGSGSHEIDINIDGDTMHIVSLGFAMAFEAVLTKGVPSGLWSFEHREELINRDNTPPPTSISIGGETIDVGVTNVVLGEKQITDINELRWLTHVTELNLRVNSISDINALTNLTTLTWLNLFNNSITDINAISRLTELETLFLSENPITDISALEGLTNLTFLAAYSCSISDISVLGNLTKLDTLLLSDNLISDITALKGLTNLQLLRLDGNPLTQQQIDELREALPNCDIQL
jgi:hypothetical protein